MEKNVLYSWPIIIVLFFLFWPAGLYLLYKKAQTEKRTALTAAKLLKLLGIFFIIVGIVSIVAVVGIFYLILGIVLMKMSKKLLASAENVKRYLAMVVNGNMRQIDGIAAAVGKPYDTVKADLQKLIDDGYLKNAFINEATREIVLPERAPVEVPVYTAAPAGGAPAFQPHVVACPCCGANNTVTAPGTECEYCGSPLE